MGPQGEQGEQGIQGIRGEKGEDGTTIYSGTVAPPASLGNVGDFYYRTSNSNFYGPKTASGWGTPVSLRGATGATGATGPRGATGAAGTPGSKILSGTAVPTASIGAVGDFYLRTSNATLYGPKAASGWPATFISLRGPAGPQGPAGPRGATGPAGPQGPAGTANVIYSGWMSFGQAERDTTIDGTRYKVNHLSVPPLTQAIIDNGAMQVYMRFGTTVFPLPYTSRAGLRTNTVSFIPRPGRLFITRHTHDNAEPRLGFGSITFRYVLIPGGVNASLPNLDLSDYEAVKAAFNIID